MKKTKHQKAMSKKVRPHHAPSQQRSPKSPAKSIDPQQAFDELRDAWERTLNGVDRLFKSLATRWMGV